MPTISQELFEQIAVLEFWWERTDPRTVRTVPPWEALSESAKDHYRKRVLDELASAGIDVDPAHR